MTIGATKRVAMVTLRQAKAAAEVARTGMATTSSGETAWQNQLWHHPITKPGRGEERNVVRRLAKRPLAVAANGVMQMVAAENIGVAVEGMKVNVTARVAGSVCRSSHRHRT